MQMGTTKTTLIGFIFILALLLPALPAEAREIVDMVKETREFYRLFLHADLSDGRIRKILHR